MALAFAAGRRHRSQIGHCRLVVLLTLLAAAAVVPSARATSVAPFVGDWVNIDPRTPGITHVRITAPGDLAVEAWGACVPTDCVWGAQHVAQSDADDGVVSVAWQLPISGTTSDKVDFSLEADGTLDAYDCTFTGRCYTWRFRRTSAPAALYSLSVAVTGAGTVDSGSTAIRCPSLCTTEVQSGSQLLLAPTAAAGAYFDHWSGGCTGGSPLCRLTVTVATSVAAVFVSPHLTLAPPRVSRGSVELAGTATERAVIRLVADGRKRMAHTVTAAAGTFRLTWRLPAGAYTVNATATVHGLQLPLGRWTIRVR